MDIVTILDNRKEADNIFTLDIDWKPGTRARGGQFVMIWIPNVDEIPMSIASVGDPVSLTIQIVGEASEFLSSLKPGDKIGIRGPYGNGFNLTGQNILFIAGGVGIAPIMPSLKLALNEGKNITLAMGGRAFSEMALISQLERMAGEGKINLHIATDDGSAGHHGFVTDLAEELISTNDFDQILTCGPEIMMMKIHEMATASQIPSQFSMERYMKCGIGLCGSCDCGGLQVCRDGPVFTGQQIDKLDDFGKFKRDRTGKKVGCTPASRL